MRPIRSASWAVGITKSPAPEKFRSSGSGDIFSFGDIRNQPRKTLFPKGFFGFFCIPHGTMNHTHGKMLKGAVGCENPKTPSHLWRSSFPLCRSRLLDLPKPCRHISELFPGSTERNSRNDPFRRSGGLRSIPSGRSSPCPYPGASGN